MTTFCDVFRGYMFARRASVTDAKGVTDAKETSVKCIAQQARIINVEKKNATHNYARIDDTACGVVQRKEVTIVTNGNQRRCAPFRLSLGIWVSFLLLLRCCRAFETIRRGSFQTDRCNVCPMYVPILQNRHINSNPNTIG
jgi:hypothetical protein